jgi:hypothetical protein
MGELEKYFAISINDPKHRMGFLKFLEDIDNRSYIQCIYLDNLNISNEITNNKEILSSNDKMKTFFTFYFSVTKIGKVQNCLIKSLNDFMVILILDNFVAYGKHNVFKMPGLDLKMEKLIFYFENQIDVLSFLKGFVKFINTFFEVNFYKEDEVNSIMNDIEKKKFNIINSKKVQQLSTCISKLNFKYDISERTIKQIMDLMIFFISNTTPDSDNENKLITSELIGLNENLKNYFKNKINDVAVQNALLEYLDLLLNLNSFDNHDKEFYLNEIDQRKGNLLLNKQAINYLNFFQTVIDDLKNNDLLLDRFIKLMLHIIIKTKKDFNDENLEEKYKNCVEYFGPYIRSDNIFYIILEYVSECDHRSKYDFSDLLKKIDKNKSKIKDSKLISNILKDYDFGNEILKYSTLASAINSL